MEDSNNEVQKSNTETNTSHKEKLQTFVKSFPPELWTAAEDLITAGSGTDFTRKRCGGKIDAKADTDLSNLASHTDHVMLRKLREEIAEVNPLLLSSKILTPERSRYQNLQFSQAALLSETHWEKLPMDVKANLGDPVQLSYKTTIAQQEGYISTYQATEQQLLTAITNKNASVIDGSLVVIQAPKFFRDEKDLFVALTTQTILKDNGVIPAGMWLDVMDPEVIAKLKDGERVIKTEGEVSFGLARPALPIPQTTWSAVSIDRIIDRSKVYIHEIQEDRLM